VSKIVPKKKDDGNGSGTGEDSGFRTIDPVAGQGMGSGMGSDPYGNGRSGYFTHGNGLGTGFNGSPDGNGFSPAEAPEEAGEEKEE
jgi:hypothetical protein